MAVYSILYVGRVRLKNITGFMQFLNTGLGEQQQQDRGSEVHRTSSCKRRMCQGGTQN